MNTSDWIEQLLEGEGIYSQIAYSREFPPRPPRFAEIRHSLHPRITEHLKEIGCDRFYTHQAASIDAVLSGKDIVVVTGTNSGKTLCYNVPSMQMMLSEPACRALYLFPTKALAHDQLLKLQEIAPGADVRSGAYDGDTSKSQRASIRNLAHIVLTNPDMLHVGILPAHQTWDKFFKSLRLIVIDEMHTYRGVFGSHVGGVIRRLLRICDWYHSHPQIVACSATIGNPAELFSKLTGRQAEVISDDGSPQGKRTFVFWNPPLQEDQTRVSPNRVSAAILEGLAESNVRTMAFCKARIATELVLRYARRAASASHRLDPSQIEAYRAGYTIKERRDIEKSLSKGDLLGLASTNAMELGVDIGGLDAIIMNGYPGTSASFWQQAGRAGRGYKDSLAVYVAHDDPLEQFLLREPHRLLESQGESIAINPFNPTILADQLRCAAYERPLSPLELSQMGGPALAIAEELDRSGVLELQKGYFFYPAHEAPAPKVSIRGAGGEDIKLLVDGEELGSMEYWRSLEYAHKGAVYLHRDTCYVVKELDLENHVAHLEQKDADYMTFPTMQCVVSTAIDVETSSMGKGNVAFGGITVTRAVMGAQMKSFDGNTTVGEIELDLPPITFDTTSFRLELPFFEGEKDAAGLHGVEHALMAVAPLIAGCDRRDLGSAWYAIYPDTLCPALFVYDDVPGGVGLAEKLYEQRKAWVSAALQLLKGCSCDEGCPGCMLSARCECGNAYLDKALAIQFLEGL
jgi:DEAD/DEAH box helicase domain-containing protein